MISLLSAMAITASSVSAVAACGGGNDNEIIVQMNKQWVDAYNPAITAINAKFESLGLDFRAKTKELDVFDNYDNIGKKGVRDKNTPDIFMLGYDRYQGYKAQNNIKDLSSEIKSVLIKETAKQEKYGLTIENDKIQITQSHLATSTWEGARIAQSGADDYYGMVPAWIENLIWIFDKDKLGIEDGKLVGSYVEDYRTDLELGDDPVVSLENLAKINRKAEKTVGYFRTVDGYYAGNALNGVLHANEDKITPVTGSSKAIVYQKQELIHLKIKMILVQFEKRHQQLKPSIRQQIH
ncbi:putative lipoprotein [Spiroplasma clarkii]|nr:putative lipoprotein [Spiroplasma clarkii]